jgi:hypothetical protein
MRKSLQPPQGQAPSAKRRHSRWRTIIVLAACLSLVATSWITAQQAQRQVTRKVESPARPATVLAPSGFTPNAPAKEYIYAGGKLVATEEPTYFNDVSTADPYYSDIMKIAAKEVTLGCGGGNYCTNQNVTREQMAAFIIRALGMHSPPTPAQQRFNDVPPSNIFYAFIEQMALRGITLGCGGGNYCPTDYVTHEQMAAFMHRARPDYTPPPTPTTQTFCDVPLSNIFAGNIKRYAGELHVWEGCEQAIIPGYPETTGTCADDPNCQQQPLKCFCPSSLVTRRQMARILVRNFGL